MQEVSINKSMKLSQHFMLGELCKTKHDTEDGNIPSRVAIENLKRICENWLEDLRYSYNTLYCLEPGEDYETSKNVEPIIINSGYRSPAVNLLAGGAKTSNHLSGCAVDILVDIADGTKQDYDELLLEQHGNVCWLHFAVKPKDNRRRIALIKA